MIGWSSNLTKPLPVANTKSLMESQVKQKQRWFDVFIQDQFQESETIQW